MSKDNSQTATEQPGKVDKLYQEHHRKDAVRLQRVLNDSGAPYTLQDAEWLWMTYSEELYAAGWMSMPASDEDLLKEVAQVINWK